MNSTGLALSQADLIRNFVLMGLEPSRQEQLYEELWRPMELAFGQDAYNKHFDSFMRHYLTVKTSNIPKVGQVYEAFKSFARDQEAAGKVVDTLLTDLRKFADHYCALAFGRDVKQDVAGALRDLRELEVDVAYPLLLELYDDYSKENLAADDLAEGVRLIENYVFRRAVCAIPTNSLNRTFATFGRFLKKDRYLESIRAHFQQLPSYRRYPNDEEFQRELKVRDLYNFRNRSYWLRKLENYGRKEHVAIGEYTIEHILPQNENLSKVWRESLGNDWEEVRDTLLHTLGNLTLTGYNSEYSDRPFTEKRDMNGGFRRSPLRVNKGLGDVDSWDEDAIRGRAEHLARKAVKVWNGPSLSPEMLRAYQPAEEGPAKVYALENHPHLVRGGTIRILFDAFRTNVMALDPCVSENFLKLYVAYKAETNFVDVEPHAERLRLTLNMQFHELQDPNGIAEDLTNVNHWGSGDVRVELSRLKELSYVLGLVRQAFEKQMGNVEVEG